MAVQVLEQEQTSTIGWPFGLPPLNTRLGVETFPWEDPRLFVTSSPSFSSSSGLETEVQSTVSFFGDRSVTLGRLIGFTNGHPMSTSVRQPWNGSHTTQAIWAPHYKRKRKSSSNSNSSWSKWLSKLMPCQSVKPDAHGNIHVRGSLPSLGQLLNLEELEGSSASTRTLVNFVYTGSSVNNASDSGSRSSLDPLSLTSSGEQGAHEYGPQTEGSIIPFVQRKPTSGKDDRNLAKSRSFICFRRSTPQQ